MAIKLLHSLDHPYLLRNKDRMFHQKCRQHLLFAVTLASRSSIWPRQQSRLDAPRELEEIGFAAVARAVTLAGMLTFVEKQTLEEPQNLLADEHCPWIPSRQRFAWGKLLCQDVNWAAQRTNVLLANGLPAKRWIHALVCQKPGCDILHELSHHLGL